MSTEMHPQSMHMQEQTTADFTGEKLIVVGGSSGIGRETASHWVTGAIWNVDGGVMAGRN